MAKTRTITAPSGADANLRTLGDSNPAQNTIAGVIRDALKLVAALKFVCINLYKSATTAKAVVVATGASAPAPTSATLLGHFVKDDPSKAASPWTFVPESGLEADDGVLQLQTIVAERKPSMSVESLTNALEDLQGAEGHILDAEYGLCVYYDQADGLVHVKAASYTNLAAYDPATAYTEEAAFVGEVAVAAGAQFGE